MRERDIEAYMVKRVKAMGGEVRKVKWIGRRGAPDRLVMLPAPPALRWCRGTVGLEHRSFDASEFNTGRRFCMKCGVQDVEAAGRAVWVELKATGVAPEPHQLREHARMRRMGQRVEVIDSLAGVEELLS